jgi:hypothetical protein
MSKEKKVIYEPHPVSAERKAELVKSGYKILDVIFQPVELLAPTKQKPKGGQPE